MPDATDLRDAAYARVAPLLPATRRLGRPCVTEPRRVLEAILYALRAGCASRLVPREYPPCQTVSHESGYCW